MAWTRARAKWIRAWPHVRTLLIVYHVIAVLVMALPSPHRMTDKAAWKTPQSQEEFARWADNLESIGIDLTPAELESKMWNLAVGYLAVRKKLMVPIEPYRKYAGVGQGWRMFSRPQKRPGRVHIEILRNNGDPFETLYVERSSRYTWRARQFDHNRIRKLFGRFRRNTRPHAFEAFSRWIATEAAREFPDAIALRVRLERWDSLTPDRVRAGETPVREFTLDRMYQLARLR